MVNFENLLILAPMAGYTDYAFRNLCSNYGADATITEMISAKSLLYNNQKTVDLLKTNHKKNILLGVQIFGNDPKIMSKICIDKRLNKFDFIDINMGCPAPKIVKNNQGSALMLDEELAYKIINECVKKSDKPITVKFRLGWDSDTINALSFALMCQKAGASAVIIHGRTKEQGYSGSANLNIIKNIKEKLNIPVIVNGDIKDLQAFKNAKEMGFNSIMIGRGALGRPFIFREIKKNQNKLTKKNIKKAFKSHFKYLKSEYHEKYIVNSLKKHVARYLTGLDNASTIKRKALRLDRSADIYKTVIKFLNN